MAKEDMVYDSDNLWDIIDGAADLYLEYAFVDLHIARYISTDSTMEIKAELYRHGTEADAFGIYSQERDPAYNFIHIGIQGYLQKGVLNYLDGVYYIKLSTYQEGDTAQNAMRMTAGKIEEHLKQNKSWPKALSLFPAGGRLPDTEQYIAGNFLGYGFFHSAYMVTYSDSTLFKAFIMVTESPERAETMMSEYLRAVPEEAVHKIRERGYEIRDARNGFIAAVAQKNYLYGLINYRSNKTRETYLDSLSASLSK